MSDLVLPDGSYFSVIGNVRIGAGGQTRLAMLRHRLFRTHAGVELPIVTYNPVPSYEPIRAEMRRTGQLMDDSPLINLHEDLRVRDLTSLPTVEVAVIVRIVRRRRRGRLHLAAAVGDHVGVPTT